LFRSRLEKKIKPSTTADMCHTDQEKKNSKQKPRETETDTGCFRIKIILKKKNVWLIFQSAEFLLVCSAKYVIKSERKKIKT